jgi:hypothetical protein
MLDAERERVSDPARRPPRQFVTAVEVMLLHMMSMFQWQGPPIIRFSPATILAVFIRARPQMRRIAGWRLQASARATLRAEPCKILRIRLLWLPLSQHYRLRAFGFAVGLPPFRSGGKISASLAGCASFFRSAPATSFGSSPPVPSLRPGC